MEKRNCPAGFIGKKEAARVLGCSVQCLCNYMKRKLVPYYKFGNRVLFKESELLKAVEATRVN